MKVGCCGLGLVGMMVRFISKLIDIIVAVCVYCGLYYPVFYMVVVLFLMMFSGFRFVPSLELNLFFVGLALSFACSVMVTLRHIIIEPFGRYLDKKEAEKEEYLARKRQKRAAKRRREYYDYKEEYRERRPEPRPAYHRPYGNSYQRERPLVYRSKQDGSLIIYEYSDRFDIYREISNRLELIDTKWK